MSNWYVINVYSNNESRLMPEIQRKVADSGLETLLHDILVPTRDVTQLRNGSKISLQKKIIPGYILISADHNKDLFRVIREVPGVLGFLGPKDNPMPISTDEFDKIVGSINDTSDTRSIDVYFDIGDHVSIIEGPFSTFTGVVNEVDSEKSRLKVMVSILGRTIPVEIQYNQVERME